MWLLVGLATTYLGRKKHLIMSKSSWPTYHDGSPGAERTSQLPPAAHTASAKAMRLRR